MYIIVCSVILLMNVPSVHWDGMLQGNYVRQMNIVMLVIVQHVRNQQYVHHVMIHFHWIWMYVLLNVILLIVPNVRHCSYVVHVMILSYCLQIRRIVLVLTLHSRWIIVNVSVLLENFNLIVHVSTVQLNFVVSVHRPMSVDNVWVHLYWLIMNVHVLIVVLILLMMHVYVLKEIRNMILHVLNVE